MPSSRLSRYPVFPASQRYNALVFFLFVFSLGRCWPARSPIAAPPPPCNSPCPFLHCKKRSFLYLNGSAHFHGNLTEKTECGFSVKGTNNENRKFLPVALNQKRRVGTNLELPEVYMSVGEKSWCLSLLPYPTFVISYFFEVALFLLFKHPSLPVGATFFLCPPLSSNVSLSNTPFLSMPPPPPLPPPRHLTTRCGNPITHVRIPAGQEEGGPKGGRMWTEHNCVKARGLSSRQLDTLHFSSFFGQGKLEEDAEGWLCAETMLTPEPPVTHRG